MTKGTLDLRNISRAEAFMNESLVCIAVSQLFNSTYLQLRM